MAFSSQDIPQQMQSPEAHMQPQSSQVPRGPNCLKPVISPQQTPLVLEPSIESANLTSFLKASQTWCKGAAADLMVKVPSLIVPAISPAFVYRPSQSQNFLYLPHSLWNVRCLSPLERCQLYIEFCGYGRIMRDKRFGTPEYKSAFELIVDKSRDIAQRERQWYTQFIDPRRGSYEQRAQQLRAIVAQQANPVDTRSISSASNALAAGMESVHSRSQPWRSTETAIVIHDEEVHSSTNFRGQKRLASRPSIEADCRPTKKGAFKVDALVLEERSAKAKADHQRYMQHKQVIDQHYLQGDRSRKPTDPEWQKLAVFDADEAVQQTLSSTKKRRCSSAKQAKGLHADTVACPEVPSRDLASYPLKTEVTYMCLHLGRPCGGQEDCTIRNHDCCRSGLSLRELEAAVRRKEERVCAQIEELAFRDGNLDKRHKTWEAWFSKDMRNRDRSRVKAHVAPICWTYDERTLQARSTQ